MALTHAARDEIDREINRVLDDVNGHPPGPGPVPDRDDQLLATAHYFTLLSAQVAASGLTDGAQEVAHRLGEEARRLRRLAGGSFGSTHNSSL